jgi:cytochrome c oxidase assembly protein subunit 11
VKQIELHPGELKKVNYFAQNLSGSDVVGQAIYSVTPVEAARYFKKTECFCYTQQLLKSGESKKMPVLFMLEPDLPENIKEVTLSYTFFNADKYASK